MTNLTQMEKEADEAPQIVQRQWRDNEAAIKALAEQLKQRPPQFVMTIARGSSDHAATFAKYLFETRLGLPVVSAAPSVLTLYENKLHVKNALVIGISQSGKSPDLCEMMQMAKDDGAITVAFVNEVNSPLAKIVDHCMPLHAGKEHAVAATKSYIASLSALTQLIAYLAEDKQLIKCGQQLPEALQAALDSDWSAMLDIYQLASDTLVLGRGYGFPIAQEAALKFKETLSMHAEAFSGAEVIHGPLAIVKKDYPLLMFTQNDASFPSMLNVAQRAQGIGAKTLLAIPDNLQKNVGELDATILSLPDSLHPICDPLMTIQAFYPVAAKLAVARGLNPDKPENLQKVTETR